MEQIILTEAVMMLEKPGLTKSLKAFFQVLFSVFLGVVVVSTVVSAAVRSASSIADNMSVSGNTVWRAGAGVHVAVDEGVDGIVVDNAYGVEAVLTKLLVHS